MTSPTRARFASSMPTRRASHRSPMTAASTTFLNGTTAGTMLITNQSGGETDFANNSTAGGATIVNHTGSATVFRDSASAQNANITIRAGGTTVFQGNSSAGNALITNLSSGGFFGGLGAQPGLGFFDASTAGNATIINSGAHGVVAFGFPFGIRLPRRPAMPTSSTRTAAISNSTPSPPRATPRSRPLSGSGVAFFDNSTGGNARFITNGTGFVDFSGSIGPNSDKRITAGSIEGSGTYYIGAGITLVVGSNNLSTNVTGAIADFNPTPPAAAAGAGYRQSGKGRQRHADAVGHSNTYTGNTVVNGGFLDVEGSIAHSNLTRVNLGGALTGAGTVGNTLIAMAASSCRAMALAPRRKCRAISRFQSGALYFVQLNSTFVDLRQCHGHRRRQRQCRRRRRSERRRDEEIHDPAGGERGRRRIHRRVCAGRPRRHRDLRSDARLSQSRPELRRQEQSQHQSAERRQHAVQFLQRQWRHLGGVRDADAVRPEPGRGRDRDGHAAGDLQRHEHVHAAPDRSVRLGPRRRHRARRRRAALCRGGELLAYAARKSGSAQDALARIPTKAEIARNNLLDNRWSVWGSAFGGGANISGNAAVGSNVRRYRARSALRPAPTIASRR